MQAAKITQGGRLVIPASIRRALKLEDGSTVMLDLQGRGFTVVPVREAIRRVQDLCRPYLEGAGSLAEELMQERREEARRELEN